MAKQPVIRAFFDEPTNTVSYLVADPVTRQAAVIDPVLDYDHKSGEVDTRSVEAILKASKELGLTVVWALETHAHADHLSGASYIKTKTGAKIGIGEHIKDVQRIFRPMFNAADLKTDGSDFDHLFRDSERFNIGELSVEIVHTPGHTPADISYRIDDAVFVGDTLFMPDYGTARADFPGGDATSSIARSSGCSRCLPKRACSCVTITRRPDAMPTPGRPRFSSSGIRMSTSAAARPNPSSSQCGRLATPRCRRRRCCYLQSRSTYAQVRFLRRKTTGCVI